MTIKFITPSYAQVKSSSLRGVHYEITYSEGLNAWWCTCPARRTCKHVKAVSFIMLAKSKGLTLKQIEDGTGWEIEAKSAD